MKKILFTLIIVVLGIQSYSQSDIKLEDLQMPSSPAFVLLDVAPSSIERPGTIKAFTTSIVNSITENNGIPENYAVDFAPFWFFKHKNLSAFKYWGFKKSNGKYRETPFSQARFGNISAASVRSQIPTDTIKADKYVNNVAIGFRTTLIQIRGVKAIDDLLNLNALYKERVSELSKNPLIPNHELANIIAADEELLKIVTEIQSVLNRKPVFAIDLAASGAWSFHNNDFKTIESNRVGAWLTFSYSKSLHKKDKPINDNYLNIYATTRFINDNNYLNEEAKITSATMSDIGGKLEFELGRFAISYEYLARFNLSESKQQTYRSSGTISYRASDQFLVTAAFGKNFGSFNNLISQISINWGLTGKNQGVNMNE